MFANILGRMEWWGLCGLGLLKSLPAFFMMKNSLALKQESMGTQISTAIETRGVAGFGSESAGAVPCLHVTNRISIATASISILTHSLLFVLVSNICSWVISAIFQMILNKAIFNILV